MKKDNLEYWLTEHLHLSGVYWGLTALDLMNNVDALNKEEVVNHFKNSSKHKNQALLGSDTFKLVKIGVIEELNIQLDKHNCGLSY
ncbi:terpenoid cyclases/Protein prenyltransferase [Gigaspora margarita]|uniref:Terpenoid cyclases/Protein prenyltransferase n=1 Tax=Gigaspora margarita TaxID=4874 RepID=A0A8H4A5S7_GIGMA|nr:terpenoid cyclases/Protein prenyltransferase [Gigaspora margarita]